MDEVLGLVQFLTLADRNLRIMMGFVVIVGILLSVIALLRGVSERDSRRLIAAASGFALMILGVYFIEEVDSTLGIILCWISAIGAIIAAVANFDNQGNDAQSESFEQYKSRKSMEDDPAYASYLRSKLNDSHDTKDDFDSDEISDEYGARLRLKAKHDSLSDDERIVYVAFTEQQAKKQLDAARHEYRAALAVRKKRTKTWLFILVATVLLCSVGGYIVGKVSSLHEMSIQNDFRYAEGYDWGFQEGVNRSFYDFGVEYDGRYDEEHQARVNAMLPEEYRASEE